MEPLRVDLRAARPSGEGVRRAPFRRVVGQEPTCQWGVDGGADAARCRIVQDAVPVGVEAHPVGLDAGRRVEQVDRDVDEAEDAGVDELARSVAVAAPRDEADEARLAALLSALQAFQRAAGPEVVLDPEPGVSAA